MRLNVQVLPMAGTAMAIRGVPEMVRDVRATDVLLFACPRLSPWNVDLLLSVPYLTWSNL